MKKLPLIGLLFSFTSFGHFLLLKPSTDIVEFPQREVQIEAKFTHPMEGGPNMAFTIADSGAVINGKKISLHWKPILIPAAEGSNKKVPMYVTELKITRPGVYKVYVAPNPYFEPAEQRFIKQITKVEIEAYNLEEGWDRPLGLQAEIIPYVRPFGLWEGNTFKGKAYINGHPCRNCRAEVEYLNTEGIKVPHECFYTQVVKTDENGYFEYTVPWAGWWGFSVIGNGGTLKSRDGKEYPVELDAVLWIKAYPKPKGVK